MIVSINQPAYLPWLGYFHRIAASDLHIVLDHVQFEKNSFTNRNKILTANGACWLTVPVKTKGKFGELPIRTLEINNGEAWARKHWKTLSQAYAKAPYWEAHRAFFETIYAQEWNYLSDLCREINGYLFESLGIATRLEYSSEMNPGGVKDELVLELCLQSQADVYISGALGRDYLREELFREKKIRVVYQDYRHPQYSQSVGKSFEPYLCALDLLFNHGPESYRILMQDNPSREEYARGDN